MARAYYTPGLVELIHCLVLGEGSGQDNFPWQIRVPKEFQGRPYGDLCEKILGGWPGEEPAIPLGIYRCQDLRVPDGLFCVDDIL